MNRHDHLLKWEPALAILMAYFVMHGGLLFILDALYWDDWVLFRSESESVIDLFNHAGKIFGWVGYLHLFMLSIGPWVYKVSTLALMLATGMCLIGVLRRIDFIPKSSICAIVLLFLVLPFNFARVALINFPAVLCYFLFFAAWRLIDRAPRASLALFFVSFNAPSLLMFYALPMLELLYREGQKLRVESMLSFARKRAVMLSIPAVFFAVKTIFFAPYGMYAGYNTGFRFSNIWPALTGQLTEAGTVSIEWPLFFVVLVPAVLIARASGAFGTERAAGNDIQTRRVLIAGLVALVAGLFPYWILGHVPTFSEWTSRHQLLMPLGAALLITGLLIQLTYLFRVVALAVLLAASVSAGISTYANLYSDWKKQQTLIDLLAREPLVRASHLVVIDDKATNLDALRRVVRFYEWNAMLEAAHGDQVRFAITPSQASAYLNGDFDSFFTVQMKAAAHKRSQVSRVALVSVKQAGHGSRWVSKLLDRRIELTIKTEVLDLASFAHRAGR